MSQEPQNKQEGQPSHLIPWAIAIFFISLLSACFIANCLVTHYSFLHCRRRMGMFKLPEYYTKITCTKEESKLKGSTWNCCPTGWRSFQDSCYLPLNDNKTWAKSERNCTDMGAHLVTITSEAEQKVTLTIFPTPSSLFPFGDTSWYFVYCVIMALASLVLTGRLPPVNCPISSSDSDFVEGWGHAFLTSASPKSCAVLGALDRTCLNFIVQFLDRRFSYFLGLTDEDHEGQWSWVDKTPFDPHIVFWHEGEPNNYKENENCVVLVNVQDKWAWNDFPCKFERRRICKLPGTTFN